jgi:hypothetical protein
VGIVGTSGQLEKELNNKEQDSIYILLAEYPPIRFQVNSRKKNIFQTATLVIGYNTCSPTLVNELNIHSYNSCYPVLYMFIQ